MSIIKATYTNKISKIFGKIASHKFNPFCQKIINKIYVKITGVDLSEFEPIETYKTLNELFTRKLKNMRDFSKKDEDIISPCDSLISEAGDLNQKSAMQIKGFSYNIDELLTDNISEENRNKLINAKYINFYLSPKDYHRYHVPMDMRVTKVIHIPGLLYPVNFTYLKKIDSLFVKNERVVLECYDSNGKLFYMVLVGALNVGKMTLNFEKRVETNSDVNNIQVYEYENIELKKGDELGMFMMGSTIVMIFEKDFIDIKVEVGQKIRFTDLIAKKI